MADNQYNNVRSEFGFVVFDPYGGGEYQLRVHPDDVRQVETRALCAEVTLTGGRVIHVFVPATTIVVTVAQTLRERRQQP